jgi:predicted outer membrane protein
MPVIESIQDLETKWKSLNEKRDTLIHDKAKIEGELNALKRELKEKLEQARKEGFDPENLPEEIRHQQEVLSLKLTTYATDLEEAERALRPMKQLIESS